MSHRIADFLVACILVSASAHALDQTKAVPPANFHEAALRFLDGPNALLPIQLDEIRLDAALRNAHSVAHAEDRLRAAGKSGAIGPNQRVLGEADATRGVIAFQQGEIERLFTDIKHRVDGLAKDLDRLDELQARDCHRDEAVMDCGGTALGARYRTARENALSESRRAIAHARSTRAQIEAIATARPAGVSLRSSAPGLMPPGK